VRRFDDDFGIDDTPAGLVSAFGHERQDTPRMPTAPPAQRLEGGDG
jgi:hypothetical protein